MTIQSDQPSKGSEMQRIAIVGTSGSGKSTLGRKLAERMGSTFIELDELFWGPNWTERNHGEVRTAIDRQISTDAWVCAGNYRMFRDLIWQRADTLIWLDYSFPRVWAQSVRRAIRRIWRKEELFSGNRETIRQTFMSRRSILLWVLQSHWKLRSEIAQDVQELKHRHLQVVKLATRREADILLEAISTPDLA